MTLEEIYTPLDEAREEVRLRWNDAELRRQVEAFLGGPPQGTTSGPCAYFCRALHTPNREFYRFVEQARAVGCPPCPLEYNDDRFCSLNPDKLGLLRLTWVTGTDKSGKPLFRRTMVADEPQCEGVPFRAITTRWGENLIGFHHRLLCGCFPEIIPADESVWIHAHGTSPKQFYPAVFARLVCHGVLFENYIDRDQEAPFVHSVVLPAFETVRARFGKRPLIVPLLPQESSDDPSWTWYDGQGEAGCDSTLLNPHPS
jgi:hypothetical protein